MGNRGWGLRGTYPVYGSELRDRKDPPGLLVPTAVPPWLSLPQAEAHPAMLVVETLLASDKEERPRREPSRDCRKLSEG